MTMAEFDAAGFSEFDKFFGGDNDSKEDVKDSLVFKEAQNRKGKRGGVGSAPTSLQSSSTELSKRLLKVGTKRSRNKEDDDGEEEYENDNREADDDDEEDVGRTGISSKESSVVNAQKDSKEIVQPSKKKKVGKKERQKMKDEVGEQKEEMIPNAETTESNENNNDTNDGGDAIPNKRKPKRRKIRSKQKNIRKDTRAMNEKPKHLRVGASNYQGRPLTDETRAKLNLAPSKSKTAPLFVIDRSPAPKVEEGVALGVEDLLAEPAVVEEKNANKKTKKKKGKRKYKNV